MPTDEVLPPPQPSSCPFLQPLIMPSKIAGQVDYRPIPCLGKRDPIKGGGCAAWSLCQDTPKALLDLAEIAEERGVKL